MIKKANISHKKQMSELWSDAFGDKKESVLKYLETLLEYFFVYEEDSVVKGMLSVLPVTLNEKKGGYIYAVVTHPEYRGKGICKELMESVKADAKYDFLVLVPQNKGLFEFYKKMDFTAVSFLKKEEVLPYDKADNYLIKSITPREYEIKRNEFYKNQNFIKWNEEMLEFAKDMYGGDFCEIFYEGNSVGIAFLYMEKKTVFAKELLTENHKELAKNIGGIFGANTVNLAYESGDAEHTFMVYPRAYFDTKFGIFLD